MQSGALEVFRRRWPPNALIFAPAGLHFFWIRAVCRINNVLWRVAVSEHLARIQLFKFFMRNCYHKGQRLGIEPFHLFAKSVALTNFKHRSAQVWRLARPCIASYGPSRCLLQPARPARRVSRLTVPRVAFLCLVSADSPSLQVLVCLCVSSVLKLDFYIP